MLNNRYSLKKRLFLYGPKHLYHILSHGRFRMPFRLVLEVTNRCNLECRTCYWRKDIKERELTNQEWEDRIDELIRQNPSVLQAVWMGGEPILRFDLIKKLSKKFAWNHVFTNGTIPLEPLERTKYIVSIKGINDHSPDKNNKIYNDIKRNLRRSKVGLLNIIFLTSNANKESLEDFVKEWSREKKVGRIIFSFYVPNSGDKNDLWVPPKERDRIIINLQKLAKKYPKIQESAGHLESLLSRNFKNAVKGCYTSLHNHDIHLDSEGKKKFVVNRIFRGKDFTCSLNKADCRRCGSDPMARVNYMSKHPLKHTLRVALRQLTER